MFERFKMDSEDFYPEGSDSCFDYRKRAHAYMPGDRRKRYRWRTQSDCRLRRTKAGWHVDAGGSTHIRDMLLYSCLHACLQAMMASGASGFATMPTPIILLPQAHPASLCRKRLRMLL